MIDEKEFRKISLVISHALCHEPYVYGLVLDENGWVSVDDILSVLWAKNSKWYDINSTTLEKMIAVSDKKRYEIYDGYIRAAYGHSFRRKLQRQATLSPVELYHGTSPGAAEQIFKDGLLPMGRQYVHLSIDTQTAMQVGMRKSEHPIILKIKSQVAMQQGVIFYKGNDTVWLSDYIPKKFIEIDSQ